jgi:RNA polymerase sigma-70 factor (ECF subfamily)
MHSASQGDKDAFAILVGRHVNALYHYALRLSLSPASAEDLVQDAWLAAWQHAARFDRARAKVSTWLHRIVHNKFVDHMRKAHSTSNDEALSTAADTYNAEDVFADSQAHKLLDALVTELPQNQRAAIVLSYVQGFSNREVAQIMSIRLRAAESLLARARATLRTAFIARTCATRRQSAPIVQGLDRE